MPTRPGLEALDIHDREAQVERPLHPRSVVLLEQLEDRDRLGWRPVEQLTDRRGPFGMQAHALDHGEVRLAGRAEVLDELEARPERLEGERWHLCPELREGNPEGAVSGLAHAFVDAGPGQLREGLDVGTELRPMEVRLAGVVLLAGDSLAPQSEPTRGLGHAPGFLRRQGRGVRSSRRLFG